MRRTTALAAAAVALVAAPAGAQDADPSGAVLDIEAAESVLDIEIEDSIEDLEVERERAGRVTVTVASDVLFAFDRARLTRKAGATIERIAGRIRAAGGPVRVDGYTDGIGSDAYNLGLSRRRAGAVSQALRAELPGRIRITARGHGEANPVEPNTVGGEDNPEGRARNRRVTITYPKG